MIRCVGAYMKSASRFIEAREYTFGDEVPRRPILLAYPGNYPPSRRSESNDMIIQQLGIMGGIGMVDLHWYINTECTVVDPLSVRAVIGKDLLQ